MPSERPQGSSSDPTLPAHIGDRYRVVRELGRGGMADVFECVDEVSGRALAIKRLHPERAGDEHLLRLFELEFHTLAQLAHPRIVAVYDYENARDGAFYCMELLAGEDLRQPSQDWRSVCKLLCDVCSALSLLHSRRLVHRDVTPRNIRLTSDGTAKLIDFGAMVPFGAHRRIVGTPSFTPPEAATCQPLDGRADLFALGASAYYALTGRHAYPARSFDTLRNAWRSRPAVPSRYAPEIPPELDQLVMGLLALAPAQRPSSAAAVIERASAIAGLTLDDQLHAQRACLTIPTLVGRDLVLQQVRRVTISASRGRGASLLLTGPHGAGRTRMIDACVLEGKLANALVLRADAGDGEESPWGSVRAVLDQLCQELGPKASQVLAPHAAVLAHAWPRATELTGVQPQAFPRSHELRPAIQEALLSLMDDVTRLAFVLVTADDLARIDEPSRAFVALLAERVALRRLLLVASAADEAMAAGFEGLAVLQNRAKALRLAPLTAAETERLLLSMFGDAANVRLLANRIHALSQGLPDAIVQLAQYLLDRHVIAWVDGHWILPSELDPRVLPSSVADALRARTAELDAVSLTLAQAIAFSGKPALTRTECARLMPELSWSQLLERLDTLVNAQVLTATGDRCALASPAYSQLLIAMLDADQTVALHARLAEALAHEPKADMRRARHLLGCERYSDAVDTLIEFGMRARAELHPDPTLLFEFMRALPSDWMDILERAIAAAERCGRSRRQQLTLKLLLIQLPEISRPQPNVAREVATQLEIDSGLRDYAELAHITPPELRMQQALTRAMERWNATPPDQRCFPPTESIPELARVLIHIIGMMAPSMDQAFLSALPSLAPYAALSPALRIVQRDVEGTCHLLGGRLAQAREEFLAIMAELASSQDAGFTPSIRLYLELSLTYGLAIIETMLGLPDAAPRIDRLERDPFFEVGAWRLRFLRALSQGDATTADWCERKAELIKIRNPPTQFFQGVDAWYETQAHVEVGDVARLLQVLPRLDAMAAKYPQWSGAAMYGRAHLARLRGDVQTAVQLLEAALPKAQPGVISWYIAIARSYVLMLVEAGRASDARKAGELHLRLAEEAGLITRLGDLQHALAAAALAEGDLLAAREHLDAADAVRERWPGAAVFGGACCELRARIALAARDSAAFDEAAEACAKAFLLSGNPILVARHQRLLQDAERQGVMPPTAARSARPGSDELRTLEAEGSTQTTFQVSFMDCPSFEQRVARALWLATGQHASRHAMLYLVRDKLPVLVGQRGECPQPERFQSVVQRYFQSELEEQGDAVIDPDDLITSTVDNSAWTGPNGVPFAPALLSHKTGDGRALSGVFVFDLEGQHHPEDELLAALSVALTDAGDVEPVCVKAKGCP